LIHMGRALSSIMRLSLIGMAGAGKSFWSGRLGLKGFNVFCCDELIAEKLGSELKGPQGTIMEMGEWMGFPYKDGYEEKENKYWECEIEVLTQILNLLEKADEEEGEKTVIDTAGSVVYAGGGLLDKLARLTTVVYLPIPEKMEKEMLKAYISHPGPVLWRGLFHQRPGESKEEALARCYPKLISSRRRVYERYAHVTIDYERCRHPDFGVKEFLKAVLEEEA